MGAFTRNEWNEIIGKINEKRVAPPESTDCEPLEPIELVDENHVWTSSDVQEAWDAVLEMDHESCMEQPDPPDVWKQEILDDIEAALENAWCGCEDDCDTYECPNRGGISIQYCGTHTRAGCSDFCTNELCSGSAAALAVGEAGRRALNKTTEYAEKEAERCRMAAQMEVMYRELDVLQEVVNAACAGQEVPDEICQAARQRLHDKQDEIDALANEMNRVAEEMQTCKDEANAAAAESIAGSSGLNYGCPGGEVNFTGYAAALIYPLPEIDPERCCEMSGCAYWWSLQHKTTQFFPEGFVYEGSWGVMIGGSFTPDGFPFVTEVAVCPSLPHSACASNDCAHAPPCSTFLDEFRIIITPPA